MEEQFIVETQSTSKKHRRLGLFSDATLVNDVVVIIAMKTIRRIKEA